MKFVGLLIQRIDVFNIWDKKYAMKKGTYMLGNWYSYREIITILFPIYS